MHVFSRGDGSCFSNTSNLCIFDFFHIAQLARFLVWLCYHEVKDVYLFIYLFILALLTRAGSPQQHMPITVGPFCLTHPVNFPCLPVSTILVVDFDLLCSCSCILIKTNTVIHPVRMAMAMHVNMFYCNMI